MKRLQKLIISIGIAAIWLLMVRHFQGFHFETNDDRLFAEIFSGAMTGKPEALSWYINPLLGLILQFLYRISPVFPWYGYSLILFQFICHSVVIYTSLDIAGHFASGHQMFFSGKLHTLWSYVAGFLLALLAYAIAYTFCAHIQFTSTAAYLAIVGYLLMFWKLLIYDCNKETLVIFTVLQFLSFLLRSDSMLMIQPFGFAIVIGLLLGQMFEGSAPGAKPDTAASPDCTPEPSAHDDANRSVYHAATFLKILGCVFFVVLSCKLIFSLSYQSEGWQEYSRINDGVTEITDYSSIPEYEQVKHILNKYDVSKEQYEAFFQYCMIEPNLSGDCLLEIAAYAKRSWQEPTLQEVIHRYIKSYEDSNVFGIFRISLMVFAFFLICLVLCGDWYMLFPLIGMIFSRLVIWMYLIYRGRIPFRVIYPLWVMETLIYAVMLLGCVYRFCHKYPPETNSFPDSEELPSYRAVLPPILIIASALCIALVSGYSLQKQFGPILEENRNDAILHRGLDEITEYTLSHPENHYFVDSNVVLYFRGSAFDTVPNRPRNFLLTGTWYSGAPMLYEAIESYAPDDRDIYLIVTPELQMQGEKVIDYFEIWRGSSAELSDSFTTSIGGVYEVYRFPAR